MGMAKVGGCLLEKIGGITKLSELTIDADKDWLISGISNIKELALAMAHGDVPFRGSTSMSRLPAAAAGFLQTGGPGHDPRWSVY